MSRKKIEPIGDKIVIKQEEADNRSKGGIYIPEKAQDAPKRGTVLAVGPGKRTNEGEIIPMQLNKGDVVVFAGYAGVEVNFEDKKFLIMTEADILGRVIDC